ncbi:BadF/BadG/BcrA/BcrD ATPase family protein [Flexibacterium corallicola]|uniref:BadF/BadG/BcrA/BcrD ATPase family protein n=1 Tax=Flexibacterium corallicola TaxID=3037259 RepID=UPI00286F109E|nr:BadF/BadG/BcrA/BcrD ATPase family protein [Pseudovibrio sp. M1P-2-3]
MEFLLGIDGGGTSCRALLSSLGGQEIARGQAGSANVNTDQTGTCHSIQQAIKNAFDTSGWPYDLSCIKSACIGLAGVNVLGEQEKAGFLDRLGIDAVRLTTDTHIALEGAHEGRDGIIAILGTGSALLKREGDVFTSLGGWGFQLGDQAGGAFMGREALRRTLLAHDGILEESSFTRSLLAHFSFKPENIVEFSGAAKPQDYAAFMPLLLEHWTQNDPVATLILEESAAYIKDAFKRLNENRSLPIALLGGISSPFYGILEKALSPCLQRPKGDALQGAVLLARQREHS